MNNPRGFALLLVVLLLAGAAGAQTLTIYDEAMQNSFDGPGYSYGGGSNFASTAEAHGGTFSISFVGNSFNAVSFARPSPDVSTAEYPFLRFWIHGGTTGNQQLRVYLQGDTCPSNICAHFELDSYVDGGAIAAGVWREVTIPLTGFTAAFDRIDLQSDQFAPQGVLYIDDVVLGQEGAGVVDALLIEQGVTVASMVSDRFTWKDSNDQPRVAVLAHNNGQTFNGARGGALREFRYQLPNGSTRVATVTTYGNAGYGGFGYVVSHASRYTGCVGDDSPLGGFQPGVGFERVFEGRHHAIFRFTQNYPRNCGTTGGLARKMPVTIDWMISTGHDNPVWAITFDVDQTFATSGGAIAPANTFYDDSRAPYGELNIDGDGFTSLDGTAWGDRWKFTTTTSPITLNSAWTWNVANTVPYVKEWLAGPLTVDNKKDATMGIVQTQTLDQQDAGGGRDPGVGSDIRGFWNKTSAMGNACGGQVMPCENDWPYQANANSVQFGNNNARMTWKTQYGFLGQNSYTTNNGGPMTTAAGYPKKSYSTYIVLGTHTTSPVEAQVAQVETIQSLVLEAPVGSVVTSGPAGITRADNVTYDPPGYNHVYGALAFSAQDNALEAKVEVGAGTLKKPLFIVSNYTGGEPEVKFGGVLLTADVDYFASLREVAGELWITLNFDLTGAINQLQIVGDGGAVPPAAPTNVVATAFSSTQVNITWTAVAGADSYEVDRKAAGGAFTLVGSPAGNSFSDTTASANTAYLYQVRAVNGAGTSPNSGSDLATTVIFTDNPVTTAIKVKLVHLSQLRTAVNAVRALGGLGAAAFTDAAVAGLKIKAVHFTELRNALDQARAALLLSTGGYNDAALANVKVKVVHTGELRDRVK
jgi:hypothetical protein